MIFEIPATKSITLIAKGSASKKAVFAQLRSPNRKAGFRNWTIHFINSDKLFDDTPNDSGKTREDALYNLRKAVRICSDYQLGLTDNVGESFELDELKTGT